METSIVIETEDTITNIIYNYYGHMKNVDEVMERNRTLLSETGVFIPSGSVVFMPDYKEVRQESRGLW